LSLPEVSDANVLHADRFVSWSQAVGSKQAPSATSVLQRVISLSLREVSIKVALGHIQKAAIIRLTYDPASLGDGKVITLIKDSITVGDALRQVLRGTGLNLEVAPNGNVMLVRLSKQTPPVRPDSSGSRIRGRVIDSASGEPVSEVSVILEGDRRHHT